MFRSIRAKLLTGFGVLLLLVAYQSYSTWRAAQAILVNALDARDESIASERLAIRISESVFQVWQWLTDVSATRAAEGFDDGWEEAATHAESFLALTAEFEALNPDLAGAMVELRAAFDSFHTQGRTMARAYVDDGPAAGNALMGAFDEEAEVVLAQLEDLRTSQENRATASLGGVVAASVELEDMVVLMNGLCLVVGLVISMLLTYRITGPLKRCLQVAEAVAGGDLTHRADPTSRRSPYSHRGSTPWSLRTRKSRWRRRP